MVTQWGPSGAPATAAPPHFSAHIYCGQTVAHLSNCWPLVLFLYQIYREPLNGFATNSHGRHVWSVDRMSLKVKVNFRRLRAVAVWKKIFALVNFVGCNVHTAYIKNNSIYTRRYRCNSSKHCPILTLNSYQRMQFRNPFILREVNDDPYYF